MRYLRIFRAAVILFFLICCSDISPLSAETISLGEVIRDGLDRSFDSYIFREEFQSALAQVDVTRAGLYPKLSLRFGQEYAHVFNESSGTISVGDAILTGEASGYKHSLLASAQYTLFDFGIRKMHIRSAERDVEIAALRRKQNDLELKLKLLDLYTEGLRLQAQVRGMKKIARARQLVYRLTKRLSQAGSFALEQVGAAALEMAESFNEMEDEVIAFENQVSKISFYTRKKYALASLTLGNLPTTGKIDIPFDPMSHPEIRLIERRIANKRTELHIVERSNLPVLTLYGAMRQFGSSDESYADSVSALRARDASITFFIEYPLFDGFENRSKKQRLSHEIVSLQYQRDKKRAQLELEFLMAKKNCLSWMDQETRRSSRQTDIISQEEYKRRLAKAKKRDQIKIQKQMINLIKQQLNLDLEIIDARASAIRVNFLKDTGS